MTEKTWRVMKFGGSSVGHAERLLRVVQTIARQREQGPLAVVVSAMGDSTDWLIEATQLAAKGELEQSHALVDRIGDLATSHAMYVLRAVDDDGLAVEAVGQIVPTVRALLEPLRQLLLGVSLLKQATAQSLDLAMSFGERLSATLVALLLRAHGVPGFFLDARTWTRTDDTFNHGNVDWEVSLAQLTSLEATWHEGDVPVCTGFLGQTEDGRTTTLGRNGSDYTATLLARALSASEVIISTDVSGVMTADPHIVDDAYPVAHLSYLEALELANYGAKMFHPRTMLPLIESGIPMRICNTMREGDAGTLIASSKEVEHSGPVCVTSLEHLALVDVRWRQLGQQVQMGQRVLGVLEQKRVTVWMATQAAHGQAVAVVIPGAQLELARGAIEEALSFEIARHEVAPIGVTPDVTLLSLVAEEIDSTHNVAGRFFDALGMIGVSVLAIAQGESSRSISCVIPARDTQLAVRTVHTAFNFAHQEVNLLVLGTGVVGSQLIEQIITQTSILRESHDIALRVVGVADSKQIYFSESAIAPEHLVAPGEHAGLEPLAASPEALDETLGRLSRLSVPVLIDCTAADGMSQVYRRAFERGIHVVAANKKPLTTRLGEYRELMGAARAASRAYHYETTVGASLPVIDTLKNLVRTGDRVWRVEGAFSGTLGYLANEMMAGVKLSEAVSRARALGYTEPLPQDDLSGLDVARKALILARELGLELELDEVHVEPFVPAELIATSTVEELIAALQAMDDEFSAQVARMKSQNLTLRYLAMIDPAERTVRVGPVEVESDHPSSRLRGSESFVAFTTSRYQDYPLLVQGAGAGGAVTAAGVLADVLSIAQNLRRTV